MKKEQIEQIKKDIAAYEAAIENAEGALAEAERELEEALRDVYDDDETPQEFPAQNEPIYVERNVGYPNEFQIAVSMNGNRLISQTVILTDDGFPPF